MKRVILINFLFLFLFLGFIEILLGKWIKNIFLNEKTEYLNIPGLYKDKKFFYDVKKLYNSSQSVPIKIYKDNLGYRSRSNNNKQKVLTIGGSTTEEFFVTEGKTWQDNLDNLQPEFDFINGGLSGQSTFGHLESIKEWHSKYLNNSKIDSIIFYIGINDLNFVRKNFDLVEYLSDLENYKNRVSFRIFLKNNSFFINKFLIAKNRISFYIQKKSRNYLTSHKSRKVDFLKKGIKQEIKENINPQSFIFYKNLFSSLITETFTSFPKSKIIVIQQQIPGCRFVGENIVYDRHPSVKMNICIDLHRVYQLQENVIKSLPISKQNRLYLFPMYKKEILKDHHVYDYVHTNPEGSKALGEYINSIFKNFINN
tara:strand:+ start:360 stop:1466 length:1107 start_codon:yes stop_codon:yes gene_type:complete